MPDREASGADCFLFAGIVSNGAVQITKDVNAAVPTARSSAVTASAPLVHLRAKQGGVPATIDPLIECSVATLNFSSTRWQGLPGRYKAK